MANGTIDTANDRPPQGIGGVWLLEQSGLTVGQTDEDDRGNSDLTTGAAMTWSRVARVHRVAQRLPYKCFGPRADKNRRPV
jgi:hypothetical protein